MTSEQLGEAGQSICFCLVDISCLLSPIWLVNCKFNFKFIHCAHLKASAGLFQMINYQALHKVLFSYAYFCPILLAGCIEKEMLHHGLIYKLVITMDLL
jgi:hypothetical protein